MITESEKQVVIGVVTTACSVNIPRSNEVTESPALSGAQAVTVAARRITWLG
jgi:hypothetical protein